MWYLPLLVASVLNVAGAPVSYVNQVERAVSAQTQSVRRHWGTPTVAFANDVPANIEVMLLPASVEQRYCGAGNMGCHWWNGSQAVIAIARRSDWSVFLSHEIVESLVDPGELGVEVCDPVMSDEIQTASGVVLADFVYPGWYRPGSHGPWDDGRFLTGPR